MEQVKSVYFSKGALIDTNGNETRQLGPKPPPSWLLDFVDFLVEEGQSLRYGRDVFRCVYVLSTGGKIRDAYRKAWFGPCDLHPKHCNYDEMKKEFKRYLDRTGAPDKQKGWLCDAPLGCLKRYQKNRGWTSHLPPTPKKKSRRANNGRTK